MKVLVLNCGSSSLKFQVVDPDKATVAGRPHQREARGLIDRIGGLATCTFESARGAPRREAALIRDHEEAVQAVLAWLDSTQATALRNLDAVGHRVVHGGDGFATAVLIDNGVIAEIEALNDLAPLHNPACLSGIRACRTVLGPSFPMAAVFDTSFHRTLPAYASAYAIPYELLKRHRIRRYGFHGIAHQYATLRYAEITKKRVDEVRIITLHLGNGCSAAAIRGGRSIETSMGFTPLEGLVMGTRSGDLDPALVGYLARKESISVDDVDKWLNERSGLLGISGLSNDMRELTERARQDARARLAVEIFCHRARKYLGAYLAVLGGADAVVFSGGIGENSPSVRAKICAGMEWCGLLLDEKRNDTAVGIEASVSSPDSKILVYVIPSDEELLIARETANLMKK